MPHFECFLHQDIFTISSPYFSLRWQINILFDEGVNVIDDTNGEGDPVYDNNDENTCVCENISLYDPVHCARKSKTNGRPKTRE